MKRSEYAALVAAAGLAASVADAQSLPVQVAAMQGQSPGQVPVGVVLWQFGVPAISSNGGFVAYVGTVNGNGYGENNDEMVFRSSLSPSQTLPIGREGTNVPGTNNAYVWDGSFGEVRVNNAAHVAFSGYTHQGSTAPALGCFASGTSVAPVALPEQLVVFGLAPAWVHNSFQAPALNNASQVAIGLSLTGPGAPSGQSYGVWLGTSGQSAVQMVARGTQQAPGAGPGVEFGFVPMSDLSLTDDGNLYFGGDLAGVSGPEKYGIWGGSPASPQLLVRGGSIGTLASLGAPALRGAASNGWVVFSARYVTLVTNEFNDDALWRWHNGARTKIVQEDEEAPGAPGARFNQFGSIAVNAAGHVVFGATLKGLVTEDSNSSLWVERGAGLQMIAREAGPVPGVPGAQFGEFNAAALNSAGQLVFHTWLRGNVTSNNDGSLWAWTPGQGLTLVAREGDQIQLSTGGNRTLAYIITTYGGSDGGMATCLSDTGRIAYRASFSDGTSAIVVATVPPLSPCYANCDGSTAAPVLNVNDFSCFLNQFAAGNSAANCDVSTTPPVLNVNDFSCFLNRFAAGCP